MGDRHISLSVGEETLRIARTQPPACAEDENIIPEDAGDMVPGV
jgi:hypothetical protein